VGVHGRILQGTTGVSVYNARLVFTMCLP
jgi:hypothetical protein